MYVCHFLTKRLPIYAINLIKIAHIKKISHKKSANFANFLQRIANLCNQKQKIMRLKISTAKKFKISATSHEKSVNFVDFWQYNRRCTEPITKLNHIF